MEEPNNVKEEKCGCRPHHEELTTGVAAQPHYDSYNSALAWGHAAAFGLAGRTARRGNGKGKVVLENSQLFYQPVAARLSLSANVLMERDVMLVIEVEKHKCLYNTTLREYTKKEATEKAWLQISNTINLSVRECKDKWRKILSTFRRSFKPAKNCKRKRMYYLSRYQNFIIPFCKPVEDSAFNEDSIANQEYQAEITIKDDSEDTTNDDEFSSLQEEVTRQNCEDNKDGKLDPLAHDSRETDFSMPKQLLKSNQERFKNKMNEHEHIRYFFLSLLPEFGDMSDRQTRLFKIKLLQLLVWMKLNRNHHSRYPK